MDGHPRVDGQAHGPGRMDRGQRPARLAGRGLLGPGDRPLSGVALFFSQSDPRAAFWGALLGWIGIAIFKLPLHFLYLGKPWRFWRAFPPFSNAWKTSWFARGIVSPWSSWCSEPSRLFCQGLIAYDSVTGGGHRSRQLGLHHPGGYNLRDHSRLLRLRHELLQERPLLEHRTAAVRVPDHGRRRRSRPDHGRRPRHRRRSRLVALNRSPASC